MKAKNFKRVNVSKIVEDFDNAVMDKALQKGSRAYNHSLPSLMHSATEILAWHIQKSKAVFRKNQLYTIWKKIAKATAGKNCKDKGEYEKHFRKAGDKIYNLVSLPFVLKF